MGLSVGLDLCDDYSIVFINGDERARIYPSVICRDKKKESWYIGEEAYRMALSGKGVITDKLVSLIRKDGRSTVSGRTYTAEELCAEFLHSLLTASLKGIGRLEDVELCIAVHDPEPSVMDGISSSVERLGIRKGSFSIISHSEAFIHYIMGKEKELYNNMVAVFDLSEEAFTYHEFRVIRGMSRPSLVCDSTDLEEAFHIDVLKNESGQKLADHIIAETARKLMEKKIYSSVFLTGKGFEDTQWAGEFKEFICRRRRVIYEDGIFARGAEAYMAGNGSERLNGYMLLCDTRIPAEISLDVMVEGRTNRLILVSAGTSWYGYHAHVEFIPHRQKEIELCILPADRYKSREEKSISLEKLPERPDRCTRVGLDLRLRSKDSMEVRLRDMGFGDFYPATKTEIVSEMTF